MELLQDVVSKCNVKYVSDLKFLDKQILHNHLQEINIKDYSLASWNELYRYLFDCDKKDYFSDYSKIESFLK